MRLGLDGLLRYTETSGGSSVYGVIRAHAQVRPDVFAPGIHDDCMKDDKLKAIQ
jgi:hypothetical protein